MLSKCDEHHEMLQKDLQQKQDQADHKNHWKNMALHNRQFDQISIDAPLAAIPLKWYFRKVCFNNV